MTLIDTLNDVLFNAVISEQQPSNICESLSNLANISSTQEKCTIEKNKRTVLYEAVTINTSDWVMVMSFNSFQQQVSLNLRDLGSNKNFSETFHSSEHIQRFNITLINTTGSIILTSRVVPDKGKLYFLVELESSLLNQSFAVTPVPVACSQEG